MPETPIKVTPQNQVYDDEILEDFEERLRLESETKKREPGCECHLEEGDSPCIVHGLYEAEQG